MTTDSLSPCKLPNELLLRDPPKRNTSTLKRCLCTFTACARARHSASSSSCSASANLSLASDIASEDDEELTAEGALPVLVVGDGCWIVGPTTTAKAGVGCSILGLYLLGYRWCHWIWLHHRPTSRVDPGCTRSFPWCMCKVNLTADTLCFVLGLGSRGEQPFDVCTTNVCKATSLEQQDETSCCTLSQLSGPCT